MTVNQAKSSKCKNIYFRVFPNSSISSSSS